MRERAVNVQIVTGDLLDQDVEAIVNPWNRNTIPWWLQSALELARARAFGSIAFPLIGAGTGGGRAEAVLGLMQDELSRAEFDGEVRIVRRGR